MIRRPSRFPSRAALLLMTFFSTIDNSTTLTIVQWLVSTAQFTCHYCLTRRTFIYEAPQNAS
jgi:hypothetical protein